MPAVPGQTPVSFVPSAYQAVLCHTTSVRLLFLLAAICALLPGQAIPAIETMAVGDGANDLGMIRGSGLGVALHAKPIVAAEAAVRIDHGDLTDARHRRRSNGWANTCASCACSKAASG